MSDMKHTVIFKLHYVIEAESFDEAVEEAKKDLQTDLNSTEIVVGDFIIED